MSNNPSTFVFATEPRPLASTIKAPPRAARNATSTTTLPRPSKFRPEEAKETLTLTLMSDPRVVRGTNYSARPAAFHRALPPSQLPPHPSQLSHLPSVLRDQSTLPALPLPAHLTPASLPSAKTKRSPILIRPPTPPPVENRLHFSTQTDPLYEDLRASARPLPSSIALQTDPLMDVDTAVLFTIRSSGEDVGTEMEVGGMKDFERDVEAVVGVMVERALIEGLTEVVEEEEEKEVTRWRAAWEQQIQGEVQRVQQMEQRDLRMQREKEERILAREQRRQADVKAAQEKVEAAVRDMERREEAERLSAEEEARRPDPIIVEVTETFMPWLIDSVQQRMLVEDSGRQALRALITGALARGVEEVNAEREVRRQREFDAYVEARFDGRPLSVPSLISSVEAESLSHRLFMHALHSRPLHVETAPSAEVEAQRRIRLREEERQRQVKYLKDVIRVQGQFRARKARRRVKALRERRDLVERRKTMKPKKVLLTLHARLGMEVEWKADETATETAEEKADGVVVEVASAAPTSGSEGEAAPASTAADVAGRPSAGSVTTAANPSRPMTAGAAERSPAGLLVTAVDAHGPALHASLIALDVITHFNTTPLTSLAHYHSLLSAALPGDLIALTVYRHITLRTDQLSVEAASDEPDEYPHTTIRDLRKEAGLKAAEVERMEGDEARAAVEAMGAKPGFVVGKRTGKGKEGGGVVVGKVTAGSGAERAGLREGDLLMRVGRDAVAGVDEFKELSAAWQAGEVVVVKVRRGGEGGEAAVEVKVAVEMGAGTAPKKNSMEFVRSLRRIAGLKYAKD